MPKKATIVTNMDGLEWKRSKYSSKVQKFLKYAEGLAVKSSNFLIADSIGIQSYLKNQYNVGSKYIAYGAEIFNEPDINVLKEYNLEANNYNMLIARLEPENNIETILDGVANSSNKTPFLVVGKHDVNKFGAYLKEKFKEHTHIRFQGGIYNLEHLNNLRHFSNLYFHGHSVGGTNPSLLEAMASNSLIIANDNEFNKSILQENAFYFNNAQDIEKYINSVQKADYSNMLKACKDAIIEKFSWTNINKQYLDYLYECHKKHN